MVHKLFVFIPLCTGCFFFFCLNISIFYYYYLYTIAFFPAVSAGPECNPIRRQAAWQQCGFVRSVYFIPSRIIVYLSVTTGGRGTAADLFRLVMEELKIKSAMLFALHYPSTIPRRLGRIPFLQHVRIGITAADCS